MLKQHDIKELLSGKLDESTIRKRLLDLTPDKLDARSLKKCIEEVREFCSPDFAALSALGKNTLDCSGTGGSGRPRFNTSTTSAFVIAAAKVPVVKFGNRAATSKSGSFDLLNQLGISEKLSAQAAGHILNAAGLVFIFAPQAYPALAAISAVRASLGVATVFNFIGPLLNPASPVFRILGVADPLMQKLVAAILKEATNNTCSIVVRSACGLDEICPYCDTNVQEIREKRITEHVIHGSDSGAGCDSDKAHTPDENAEILLRIVRGADRQSYEYELTCRNAGAGLYAAGKAKSIAEGVNLARQLLASGEVEQLMQRVKQEYANHS